MKLNDQQQGFVDWLNRLLDETRQLHSLLEQEHDILQERQIDTLVAVSRDKQMAVDRIDATLAKLPRQADTPEVVVVRLMHALKLDDHSEILAIWQELKQYMARCRALNESNGAAIAVLQEHTGQALALLFGQRRQRICYGEDGQGQSEADGRWLGAT